MTRAWDIFDQLMNNMLTTTSTATFPFYDIVKLDEESARLDIAVAGFAPDQLVIEKAASRLTVSGDRGGEPQPNRGLARQFMRTFQLAEGVTVGEASLANGILSVPISRPSPKRDTVQIPIKTL